jgi:DNA-binding MarR family transcriptional regulator
MKELEHEGFIKRESVPTDARLKKIILLPAGQEINRKMKTAIEESEQRIDAALTPDEKKHFLSYCDKIRTTLEQYEDNKEDNE